MSENLQSNTDAHGRNCSNTTSGAVAPTNHHHHQGTIIARNISASSNSTACADVTSIEQPTDVENLLRQEIRSLQESNELLVRQVNGLTYGSSGTIPPRIEMVKLVQQQPVVSLPVLTATAVVEEQSQSDGYTSRTARDRSGPGIDTEAALRNIGINTEDFQSNDSTTMTYSAKETFLHRLPSANSIQPRFERKSNLQSKVCALVWAVMAVTCLSSVAPMRDLVLTTTGWGAVSRHLYAQHFFESDRNALMGEGSFTYSAMGEQYNGNLLDLEDYHGSAKDFYDAHPPGSNFTVYYDPNDPVSSIMLYPPRVRIDDFFWPHVLLPITFFWLALCFQWILYELDMKGAQKPIYMERRDVSDQAPATGKSMGGDGLAQQTSTFEEYRIVLCDQKVRLSEIFFYLFFFSSFLFFLMGLVVLFNGLFPFYSGFYPVALVTSSIGFFALLIVGGEIRTYVLLAAFYWYCCKIAIPNLCQRTGDAILLDIDNGVLRHYYANKHEFTHEFKIEMEQVTDVELKVSSHNDSSRSLSRSLSYNVILVYHDKGDPNGERREHSLYRYKSRSASQVIEMLTLLLKSEPCLPLPDDTNVL